MDTQDTIKYKYEALKAASVSQDLGTINDLVVDILSLLHKEWSSVAGIQKDTFEEAYCQVDNTFAAHKKTKQDTSNSSYLNEIGLQIGRDLYPVLSSPTRRSPVKNKYTIS
ncbi:MULTISPECIES: hypothetical protein [Spirosoma]|uniref:Uncharacterized protein n=1 Tax=Spirosoma liriopis TaxID=2937440 RepID=A0ABT0HG92_9BACT|nr:MULTISPECIES: hypothetical protein [Spirosoma]MCK8490912.1 hypothetical protein [Spirosoma liriopis]UHG90297.1 hypothetical protein LQ777_18840 [Spirosoma oryzicola]